MRLSPIFNNTQTIAFTVAATFAGSLVAEPEGNVTELDEIKVYVKQIGYHAESATTALKLDLPLILTPQSVFVINDALIEDQQAFRMDQILQNDASVQKRNNFLGAYSSYFIRGFDLQNGSNYLRNGRTFFHLASPPVEILDRVEIVKGPNSVLYGTTAPGGMVNMVTKKPMSTFDGFVKGTIGTDDLYHFHADVGGPTFKDGKFSYRINYVREDSGYFRSFADGSDFDVDRQVFYGALRWQPSEKTLINLSVDVTEDDRPQDTGIVAIGDEVADIPSDRILTQPWSFYNSDVWNFDLSLTHHFSDAIKVRTGYSFQDYKRDRYDNQPRNLDEVTGDMQFRARHRINRWDYQTVFFDTTLTFDIGPTGHKLLLGADQTDVAIDNNEAVSSVNFTTNIFNPITIPDPDLKTRPDANTGGEDRTGFYVQDVISFGEKWNLLLGLRYDEFDSNFNVAGVGQTAVTETDNLTPRAGLVYTPKENLSFYISYSESFEPNGTVTDATVTNFLEQLDPTVGDQIEVGAKTELFDGNFLLSAAVFQIHRSDDPYLDNASNTIVQRGEQEHSGFEVSATGLFGENLTMVSSFAYLDAEFTNDPAFQGNTPAGVADISMSFWGEYQFPQGFLANLSLQGGWFYEDDRPGDNANSFILDSYHRFDAGLKYVWESDSAWSTTFRLTVSNILDEEYFKGDRRLEVNPERPREIRFSAQVSF